MLESAPSLVIKKFEELKVAMGIPLSLRRISGHYYLYKMVYTKVGNTTRTSTEYLGTITANGAFIAKGMLKVEKETTAAVALLKSQGAEVKWPKKEAIAVPGAAGDELTILTILSMNGRARMKSIGNLLGITPQAAARKVKAIEKKYALEYTAEIAPVKLGFIEYLVFIKFVAEKPGASEIKRVFERNPTVQFCAVIKGSYDVMLYVLFDANSIHPELERLRFTSLTGFSAVWHIKSVSSFYGFIPLRDIFFDSLRERVWHRKSGVKEIPQYALFQRDYKVLRQLNSNGNRRFKDIDRESALPSGSSRYSYHSLLEKGILKRVTINERSLPIAYDSILQFKLINVDTYQDTRNKYRVDVIRPTDTPYNTYSAIFDFLDPDGFLAILPSAVGRSIENRVDALSSEIKGVELETIIIVEVLLGSICHRKFDNVYSSQYESLLKAKAIEQQERINYADL